MNILYKKFQSVLNIGVETLNDNFQIIRLRLFNSLLLLIGTFQFSIFISELIDLNFKGMFILVFHLLFTGALLLLNKYQKTRISIFIFNIIYPIAVSGLLFVYKEPNNLEYIFFIFLISAFLLQRGLIERLLIAAIPFACLIYSKTEHEYIGYLGKEINWINDYIILITSVLTVLLTLLVLAYELRKYEDKVNKLVIETERKNEELLDKNKELERFSYVVSHDMKTPLRAVAGYINIIEKKLKDTDEENLRYFKYIKENATQLNDLVIQTLEFSKTGQEEIEFEVVNVNELLFKLSRDFVSKDIQVYTEDFPNVLGNEVLVKKLFQNLIENGGKYNNSKEKIIEISSITKADKVIFAIKDNGIGIKEKYHTQIFEMYKRLHTKKEYAGTGLGLSISKKIAKKLQGDIYLTSTIGKGTTFYLELKLAK